jgi:hypothetical protein
MTLSDRQWGALGINQAAVAARARFHHAYATLAEPEFEARDVADLIRSGPQPGGPDRVVNLLAPESAQFRSRLAETRDRRPATSWVRPAEVADALRSAAIAELLFDTGAGRATLLRAGARYADLGLPFGDFLRTAAEAGRERAYVADRRLERMLTPDDPGDEAGGLFAESVALAGPAQQVYLVLTASRVAADPNRLDAAGDHRLGRARQARQTTGVGTTAQPMSTWWRLGTLMSTVDENRPDDRQELVEIVTGLATAHGRQLELSRYDSYHWSIGATRTDLVDLDLACAVAITMRNLRARQVRPWRLDREFAQVPPLAQISLQVGLQLGGDESPAGEQLGPGPWDPTPGPDDRRPVTDEIRLHW